MRTVMVFTVAACKAKRLKLQDPARVVGVGGCWSQSMKERVFEQFPFVDVAFGPWQVHRLAEFLTSDSLTAQGYFEFEGFTGHLPGKRAAPGDDRSRRSARADLHRHRSRRTLERDGRRHHDAGQRNDRAAVAEATRPPRTTTVMAPSLGHMHD